MKIRRYFGFSVLFWFVVKGWVDSKEMFRQFGNPTFLNDHNKSEQNQKIEISSDFLNNVIFLFFHSDWHNSGII